MSQRIAIIGGGYAGLSAAVHLAQGGHCVTVFEASKILGGRARAISHQGLSLDNGQHICLGAYQTLLALLAMVGLKEHEVFLRQPLQLFIQAGVSLKLPAYPAPWHLIVGLLQMKGISWRERFQIIKLGTALKRQHFHLSLDCSVQSWLIAQQQSSTLITQFWAPLCLAILNTPINVASAQRFIYVLRDSLFASAHCSDLLLPKTDLTTLFPTAAACFVIEKGGCIQTATRITEIARKAQGWHITDKYYDQLIIAVAPHQLKHLIFAPLQPLQRQLQDWHYRAISTVYLQYDADIKLPYPMMGCNQGLSQWVFDRGQTHQQAGLLAVVISDSPLSNQAISQQVIHEMFYYYHLPAKPIWHKVITEKQATFSADYNLATPKCNIPGLWLAGDYVGHVYPATIESAVQSGQTISKLINGAL